MKELSPSLLAKLGNNLEMLFHNSTPSRLDASVVAFEVVLFSKQTGLKLLKSLQALTLPLLILVEKLNSEMINGTSFFEGEDTDYVLERFNQLADVLYLA